jgi:hypothetical protein
MSRLPLFLGIVAGSNCCERNSSTEAMTWVLEGRVESSALAPAGQLQTGQFRFFDTG